MNTIERIRFTVLLAAVMLAGVGGCATPKMFSLNNAWPFGDDDEPKPQTPTRVAGMWTDTVLNKAGEKPQRGFGGRLIFYGKDAEKPVLVDGELVVYAFDETGREPTDNKPTRRYVFPADQISLHQSEGPTGPSYSFWLPWDDAGGQQTEVSLICRFHPKGGPVVISEQTKHLLPGALRPPGTVTASTPPKLPEGVPSRPAMPTLSSQMSRPPAASGAQQASYVVPTTAEPKIMAGAAMADASPIQHMTTTSIPLPQDFQIPRGAPPVAPSTPNVKQIVPAAQYQAVPLSAPSAATGQPVIGAPQAARATTVYQPQARSTAPTVYNPLYAGAPSMQPGTQPSQLPLPNIHSPMIAPPQLPPHPAQAVQQQMTQQIPQQTTVSKNGVPAVMSPQVAAQMMQIPTSGTATVTYR
jgi:hypothetical protein